MLEGILRQKCSLPTDQLLVIDGEDRIIFPYLTDDDMKFVSFFWNHSLLLFINFKILNSITSVAHLFIYGWNNIAEIWWLCPSRSCFVVVDWSWTINQYFYAMAEINCWKFSPNRKGSVFFFCFSFWLC